MLSTFIERRDSLVVSGTLTAKLVGLDPARYICLVCMAKVCMCMYVF